MDKPMDNSKPLTKSARRRNARIDRDAGFDAEYVEVSRGLLETLGRYKAMSLEERAVADAAQERLVKET